MGLPLEKELAHAPMLSVRLGVRVVMEIVLRILRSYLLVAGLNHVHLDINASMEHVCLKFARYNYAQVGLFNLLTVVVSPKQFSAIQICLVKLVIHV